MARFTFRLPDIGEGISEAEIVAWHVKLGDRVEEDQSVADMMTDKATVEMESPVAGVVVRLAGEPGDQVPIGSMLVEIEIEGDVGAAPPPAAETMEAETPGEAAMAEPLAVVLHAARRAGPLMGKRVLVTGCGPIGTGMEETYQLTSALKFLPFGKHVPLVTDARFSGVSTGACIGHVGPEGLAGGPIGKLKSGDVISIQLDRNSLEGFVNLVGEGVDRFDAEEGAKRLAKRETRDDIAPHSALPDDTRLWAALQGVGGGTWGGCVFDVDQIVARLQSS